MKNAYFVPNYPGLPYPITMSGSVFCELRNCAEEAACKTVLNQLQSGSLIEPAISFQTFFSVVNFVKCVMDSNRPNSVPSSSSTSLHSYQRLKFTIRRLKFTDAPPTIIVYLDFNI